MPLCSDGVNDMFTESKVHFQKYQSAKVQKIDFRGLVLKNRRNKDFCCFNPYPRIMRVLR